MPLDTALIASPPRVPAFARILWRALASLPEGALEIVTPDGTRHGFGVRPPHGASLRDRPGVLVLHDWKAIGATLAGGDVGFGESYMAGRWTTPDLVRLLAVIAANQQALTRAFYGTWWMRGLMRARHALRANSRRRARRNIVAHYDLGNDFFALWLDPSMTYSSALFDGDFRRPLVAAQHAKYDRMLASLALPRNARLLEIGAGWGGLAERAARAGHRVTGLSLSPAQTAYARARLARQGLAADLRVQDYRDVTGQYDGVASIEMIEAVGERYWPVYFDTIRRVLAPGARASIQAITIADERFARYRTQSDFIQQYIFPGGMLASPSRLVAEAARAGLKLVDCHAFGADYAQTLVRWLAAFDAAAPEIMAQGFDARFVRCWRFYLAYCAAGFATGTTDVGQYTFAAV